ncbi:Fic family protein [Candidatus Calescamantes bacterium]|nr:Fic family protein [Candidatus Calescamantes bacterium]
MKRLGGLVRYIWELEEWPNLKWKSDDIINSLSRARLAQGKLISKITALGFDSKQKSRAEILTEETMKTAAIEGVRFDREAVRSSIARKLGLPLAGLKKPDRNADGLIEMLLDATDKYDQPLTLSRIKSWQAALFPTGYSGLLKIDAGNWRSKDPMQVVSGQLAKETVHYEAPPGERMPSEMKLFMKWWKKEKGALDGLLRAGIAHIYFVTIHPFEDGNGRVARALTDMALAQDEKISQRYYSLSSRIMAEGKAYYDILERSQKGSLDITLWLEWFLDCFIHALEDSEDSILNILQKSLFWQKHAQTTFNENQKKVLNRLLDAGPGGFEGGLSTRKYVGMTKVSRATAYRDIADLVEKIVLKQNRAKGRSVSYDLIFPGVDND